MKTQFNQWNFPEFKEQPYYEGIKKFANDADLTAYYSKIMSSTFLAGGGTLGWTGPSGLLTWTDDFIVPLFMSGFVVQVRFGPDNVNRAANISPGGFLYVQLPTVIQSNLVRQAKTATQWNGDPSWYIFGFNYANVCYLKNGRTLL